MEEKRKLIEKFELSKAAAIKAEAAAVLAE